MKNERLRAIIVDDEPLAREGLAAYLEQEPEIELVGVCADGVEAVERLRENDVDLVFLDIQMPEMTGFDVIEAVGIEELPAVVFVTAYDEYALQAFDASAVDYILKPIDPERVSRAVERVRLMARGDASSRQDQRLEALLDRIEPRRGYLRKFAVRHESKIRFVDTSDTNWIEAAGNYALLHTSSGEHRVRGTMSALESKLDPSEFVRVHRSTLIRIDSIREIEPLYQGDYLLVLKDGKRVTSSRSYRENLRDLMEGIS